MNHRSLSWLREGLIAAAIPMVLLGLFWTLKSFNISFGENPLAVVLLFALAIIELPVVVIGRLLGLPIETGEAAFILYQLTLTGYVLTVFFWFLIGALWGCLKKARPQS